jgi:hypothetical protein
MMDLMPPFFWFAPEKCPRFASIGYWTTFLGRIWQGRHQKNACETKN